MNLESAIATSSARRSGLTTVGAFQISAGRHSEKDLPEAHKKLQQVLRTGGWVHKGTNKGVTAYQHADKSTLIFHHPSTAKNAVDDADDQDDKLAAAGDDFDAPANANQNADPNQNADLNQKIDTIISLLDPKKQEPAPQSDEADSNSLALGDQGFEHDNRHQIGGSRVVDVYSHPAGHQAVVQSKDGQIQGWGMTYGRGLGNATGTDANSLQQHLAKSSGFLRKEKSFSGKPGKLK